MSNTHITLTALPYIPLIQPGDDLAQIIINALTQAPFTLAEGDILVISSKIISKAENRYVDLRQVEPSQTALELARKVKKDPRLVELTLQNSSGVSRSAPNVLIVRHHLGFTSANAGIDVSNIAMDNPDLVLLLPADPDQSAQQLLEALTAHYSLRLAIVISDTHGRPFRYGNLNVAIGLAGLPALIDQRGEHDLFGRELKVTITPLADELAAAAGLISGQADEGQPVVIVRGVHWQPSQHTARDLIRNPKEDLYN